MRRRALLTGAAGFVGCHVARALVAEGYELLGLVRPGGHPERFELLPPEMEIAEIELGRDEDALARLLRSFAPELIVAAAAHGAYRERDLVAGVRTDVLGMAQLLSHLPDRGCRLVALGSSLEVQAGEGPIPHGAGIAPTSLRGTLRAASTLLVLEEARARGLDAGVLRLFSVYGPGEAETRLIPKAIRAALLGEVLPVVAPPFPTHDFVYVADVAEACLAAARAPNFAGEVWNVCRGQAIGDDEVLRTLEKVSGRNIERQEGGWQSRYPERRQWWGDPEETAARLGWRARFELEQGLRAMVDWYRERLGCG